MLVHAAERRASSALKGKARCVVHHGAADQCLAVWFLLLAAGVQVAEWAVLVVEFFIGAVLDESAVVEDEDVVGVFAGLCPSHWYRGSREAHYTMMQAVKAKSQDAMNLLDGAGSAGALTFSYADEPPMMLNVSRSMSLQQSAQGR